MHHTILITICQAAILNHLFLEKRSTYFVWLPSDLESALKLI